MQNIEMYQSQNLQNAYALADTINAWRRPNFRFQSTAVDYRGITAVPITVQLSMSQSWSRHINYRMLYCRSLENVRDQ